MKYPRVELRCEAHKFWLEIEGHSSIRLSKSDFTKLARQFVAEAHAIQDILGPPFVVRLHAQYCVDSNQETPMLVEDWAFGKRTDAEEFLARAGAEIAKFKTQWPFRIWIPSVPELEYARFCYVESVDDALADFRCCLLVNFFDETGGDYWHNHLTTQERIAITEALPNSDYGWNLQFDSDEVESWAKDGASLSAPCEC